MVVENLKFLKILNFTRFIRKDRILKEFIVYFSMYFSF